MSQLPTKGFSTKIGFKMKSSKMILREKTDMTSPYVKMKAFEKVKASRKALELNFAELVLK